MGVIITFTFVAITYGKVSLWLWKSLKNSGNVFLLLCGHREYVAAGELAAEDGSLNNSSSDSDGDTLLQVNWLLKMDL